MDDLHFNLDEIEGPEKLGDERRHESRFRFTHGDHGRIRKPDHRRGERPPEDSDKAVVRREKDLRRYTGAIIEDGLKEFFDG